MKTKTLKKNKVNVVTLGCSKNIVDSEVLMGQLKANNFDKKDVLIKIADFIFFAKNMIMKTRVRKVQTRCRVAGGEESFVLDFLFLEPVLSFCRRVSRQKKNTQFLNHLICGFILKTSLKHKINYIICLEKQ